MKAKKPPRAQPTTTASPEPDETPAVAPVPGKMWRVLAMTGVLLVTGGVYAIHFDNDFHFDDSHTIQSNAHITSLSNWKLFFTDANTFSSSLSHQGYRPLLTLGFAVDYAIGKGLNQVVFHIHSFALFVGLLICIYLLFARLLGLVFQGHLGRWLSILGTLFFALHPVMAETVNYIVQRGDLIDTLGVTGSLVLYLRNRKAIGVHLIPMFVSCFAKAASMMYAPIVGMYEVFYTEGSLAKRLKNMVLKSLPSFVLVFAFYFLHKKLEAKTVEVGGQNAIAYWRTQPYILLYQVKCFFLPTTLTADTDMFAIDYDWRFYAGVLFVLVATAAMFWFARFPRTRPIGFGLGWFLLANLPTSLMPFAEMTNDHRMFFPYVGLVLVLMNGLGLLYEQLHAKLPKHALAIALSIFALVFAAEGYGTFQRNKVWDNEESLWKDVTEKSPGNGRGMMNYGLTLMGKGQLREALAIYEKAYPLLPNYAYLETNLAIVKGALGMDADADKHFRRAVTLINEPVAHPYWARYLVQRGRFYEARAVLLDGLQRHQDHWQLRWALLDVLERLGAWGELKHYTQETQKIFPGRPELQRFQSSVARAEAKRQQLENVSGLSVMDRCMLAELRYGFGQPDAALQAAQSALADDANSWCAHRIAAFAYAGLRRWSDSVHHADLALGLAGGDQPARLALDGLRKEAIAHQQQGN